MAMPKRGLVQSKTAACYGQLVAKLNWRRARASWGALMPVDPDAPRTRREARRQARAQWLASLTPETRQRIMDRDLNKQCGAKTRAGTPCKAPKVKGRTRCKLHGGFSTGPRTETGREAIRESNRRRAGCGRRLTGDETSNYAAATRSRAGELASIKGTERTKTEAVAKYAALDDPRKTDA